MHAKNHQVLCSSSVEEETLIAQLESLFRAFCFYNGSLDDILEARRPVPGIPALTFPPPQQHKRLSRKELLAKFQYIGSFLTPLLRKSAKNQLAAFDPLPYTALPSVCILWLPLSLSAPNTLHVQDNNGHFLLASQILNRIRVEPQNIAGCLCYCYEYVP